MVAEQHRRADEVQDDGDARQADQPLRHEVPPVDGQGGSADKERGEEPTEGEAHAADVEHRAYDGSG